MVVQKSTQAIVLENDTATRGQVEMEETENWNGKLKRKTGKESRNRKAETWKWSSTMRNH